MNTTIRKGNHPMKLDKLLRSNNDVIARRLNTNPPPTDAELLRKGLSRQLQRLPGSVGDPDPDRRRELGEVEVDLGAEKRRVRLAHDPENRAMSVHGVHVMMTNVDKDLADSFESTASRFMEEQGTAEMETQRVLLGLVVSAIMRRHQFLADAVVRQLRHERFHAI
jgi:hypothetical protein